MEQAIMDLISIGGALLGSALLGVTKKYTTILDGKVGNAIKPVQPILVGLAGVGLPYLTGALGIAPVDPSVFVTAPTATLAIVAMREANERLAGRKQPTE